MVKYMPQDIFDPYAYKLAACWTFAQIDGSNSFEEELARLVALFGSRYTKDMLFALQWREGSERLSVTAKLVRETPLERANLLNDCWKVAMKLRPDAERHKKFLGFFGGSIFSRSHDDPENRLELSEINLKRYIPIASYLSAYDPQGILRRDVP